MIRHGLVFGAVAMTLLVGSACRPNEEHQVISGPTIEPYLATALAQPALAAVTPAKGDGSGRTMPEASDPQASLSGSVGQVSPDAPLPTATFETPVIPPPVTSPERTPGQATSLPALPQSTQEPVESASATATRFVEAPRVTPPEATDIVTALPTAVPVEPTSVPAATPTSSAAATATEIPPQPTVTATPTPATITSHFSGCVARTGSNATIAVPANIEVNGPALAPGDEIAVFTPDRSICAGVAVWTGQNIAITAWGDDSQTEAVDGMREGERMLFKVWLASAGRELAVGDVRYSIGDGIYTTDSIHAINRLEIGEDSAMGQSRLMSPVNILRGRES